MTEYPLAAGSSERRKGLLDAKAILQSLVQETKRSAAAPLIALHSSGRPQWTPRNYAALAREGFAANAVGYRCVRMIAEAATASLPWLAYENEAEVTAHPVLSLLARPNPGQPGREFLEMLVGFLLVSGNAYVEKVEIEGAPRELTRSGRTG